MKQQRQDRDRAMRMQGAARVLGTLARHYHQDDIAAMIMETLDISLDDIEQACEPDPESFAERAAQSTDRLIVTRSDVEKFVERLRHVDRGRMAASAMGIDRVHAQRSRVAKIRRWAVVTSQSRTHPWCGDVPQPHYRLPSRVEGLCWPGTVLNLI